MRQPGDVAQWDQVEAVLRDLAPALWKYQNDLMNLGFTRTESFSLVRDMQHELATAKEST